MRTGVLGGTFDPIHRGHLMMAAEARRALGLDGVLLVPAGRPMSKTGRRVTAARHRLAMVRLAAAGTPWLTVSTMEIDRPGPSYTADTLEELSRQRGPGEEIYFILGWDSLDQLPTWHEPDRIVRLCHLVAIPRPGQSRPDLAALERAVPGIFERVVLLDKPCVDVSASEVRDKVAAGAPVDGLVPEKVAGYIRGHDLYVKSGGRH